MTGLTPLPPFFLHIYRGLSWAAEAFAPLILRRRLRQKKENPARIGERLGFSDLHRGDAGPLIWVHAASVGESLSILPFIQNLCGRGYRVMITTVTVSAANLMHERLPHGAFHQFAPLDLPHAVRRFYEHWRPALAIWTESELWPHLICEGRRRRIPLLLLNARMSERSYQRWHMVRGSAKNLLSAFSLCMAQDDDSAERLRRLGPHQVGMPGNLKFDAPLLPVDAGTLAELDAQTGSRPRWLAASTHPQEEEILLKAHLALCAQHDRLLTVIVPRHPERGDVIRAMAGKLGIACAQRSKGEKIDGSVSLYLADTLGELGVFYRHCPIVFMGGSLFAHGGQNPLEAARFGCALLSGTHTANFRTIYDALEKKKALIRIKCADEFAAAVLTYLVNETTRQTAGSHAQAYAQSLSGALTQVMKAVAPYLPPLHKQTYAQT